MAKKTFKDRIKKNTQKERNKQHTELRKRMNLSSKRNNRFDNIDRGTRSMDQLVGDVALGSAIASREVVEDPRALANLLMSKDATSGKLVLSDEPLEEHDPNRLHFSKEMDAHDWEGAATDAVGNDPLNRNRYKHKGAPFIFWERLGLHPSIIESLRDMKFTHPTPIQEEVIPSVLQFDSKRGAATSKKIDKDVVVSAETGSGKTLVFALPILHHIIIMLEKKKKTAATAERKASGAADEQKAPPKKSARLEKSKKAAVAEVEVTEEAETTSKKPAADPSRIMHTLIVSPTRELAVQINDAFKSLTKCCRQVIVGCIVGGMAPEKQQRILNSAPHILVCTPGRLWELVQRNEGCYLGHSISRRLSFLVLDEADKLLQIGRFEELKQILERVHCEVLPAGYKPPTAVGDVTDDGAEETGEMAEETGRWDDIKGKFVPHTKEEKEALGLNKKKTQIVATTDGQEFVMPRVQRDRARPIPIPPAPADGHCIVTFVTSATLSLMTNYSRKDFKSHKSVIRTSNANTMGAVLTELGIREKHAMVFNASPATGVVQKIHETYLRCPEKAKELYLYYFLRTYRERSVIFVNAISMLRRITKILEVLGIPVVGLHASMQQRQRLKFIEKFKSGEKTVLVATDIASRGLDIEGLRYVIHYQVPRSTDAYIHRCGRTARCGGTGLSLMMVGPDEHVSFKKLMDSMQRPMSSMEVFALDPVVVHHLHPILQVALQIDRLQMQIDKKAAKLRWVTKASEEAEIDADDMADESTKAESNEKAKAVRILKKQLDAMVRREMGHFGGKGGFRSASKAVGAREATHRMKSRADRQVYKGSKF